LVKDELIDDLALIFRSP